MEFRLRCRDDMIEYNNRSLHALSDGVCVYLCVDMLGEYKNERTDDGRSDVSCSCGESRGEGEIGEGMSLDGCPLVCALFGIAGFSVLPHTNVE
jgi:hypothetical protein